MKKMALTESYLQECLKQARYYEYCKDTERALTVLQPVWTNIEQVPDVTGLDGETACEILTVCGSVISAHGTSQQKKHYKELAVNILTVARELACGMENRDLIAETEKQIATAYWRHGEFENAVAYLNTVLSKYSEEELLKNKICLMAQANLLVLYFHINQADTAFDIYHKVKPHIDVCANVWIKTVFYNQAAGLYVLTGHYQAAIPLLEKDIEYATSSNNNSYLGNALNNLANAYINLSPPDTKTAMRYVDEAVELFLSVNQLFPYAQALETKSLIYCLNNDFQKALLTIEESIRILETGENYAKLCESLWTQTEILIKSGEPKKALKQFNALLQISNENLSLLTSDRYIDQFAKLIYITTGRDFEEKELNFRRHLLDEALEASRGAVTAAANYLGILHQTLSNILKKFPDLVEKHQVKPRTRRASPPKEKNITGKPGEMFAVRMTTDRLEYLGVKSGMIIEARRLSLEELDLMKPIVIQDNNNHYRCGFLTNAFEMLAFEDGRGNIEQTFMVSEILDAGQVISVFDEESGDYVNFV